MTPRLLVYGYGRRDSPRLQAALSAAIQLSAAVTPDVAEETVHEVRGRHLQGAAVLTIDITSLVLTTMLSLLLIGSGCVCRVYLCAQVEVSNVCTGPKIPACSQVIAAEHDLERDSPGFVALEESPPLFVALLAGQVRIC